MNVIALGLFDGLHLGHMAVINAMLDMSGDFSRCVFTFNTDTARPGAKAVSRLMSQSSRDAILKAAGVSSIFEPPFEDIRGIAPEAFAKDILAGKLNAAHVFCGESFRFGKGAAATAKDLPALLPSGCEAHVVETVNAGGGPISPTRIRGLVEAGDLKAAARLLGRTFFFDFAVIEGNRIGRTLERPTINQRFPKDFALPRFGVYASAVTVGGNRHRSLTNVGVKPTVGGSDILAETYIEGYSGDLYGASVPVGLLEYMRPEEKFASLGALKTQIGLDLNARLAMDGS
jgi:riboflavin kinase/FMN adenylyltransferase